MIVPPNNADEEEKTLPADVGGKGTVSPPLDEIDSPNEPPPRYADKGTQTPDPVTARSQPTNWVSIQRDNRSVKDTFVIDPSIYLPPARLPPLQAGEKEEERKNLKLRSHNGSVDAEILLAAEQSPNAGVGWPARATLDLASHNGSVLAKVNASDRRRPVHIAARSKNGRVTLYLPRSFRGFLTLTSVRGTIAFSDAFSPNVTTLSHVSGTQRCFVGDLSSWDDRDGEWGGDEVVASSHSGKVNVLYVDEAGVEKGRKRGLLNRFFGLF